MPTNELKCCETIKIVAIRGIKNSRSVHKFVNFMITAKNLQPEPSYRYIT